mgnify:CR=1 FL=1
MSKPALATRFKGSLDAAARRMATDPRSVQDRVAEGISNVLIDDGFVRELMLNYPELIEKYTDEYFSYPPDSLDDETIIHAGNISNDNLSERRFERLYEIAEEIAR